MVKYTEAELVAFGQYLLSKGRAEKISENNSPNAEEVTHADLENWKHAESQKESLPLTEGEKLMGIKFNPSGDPNVNDVKKAFASMADLVLKQGDQKSSYLFNLLRGGALRGLVIGQMEVVKSLTFEH